ncbi:MAG: tetratricopeptide repeat protein [Cytophagales bacterium]|nr:tetratricopeptide repeat protein [Cytophagales bacterium]
MSLNHSSLPIPPNAHAWLLDFAAQPRAALDRLWSGRANRHPLARLSLSEFVENVLPDDAAWRDLFDNAMRQWLNARRQDTAQTRLQIGLNRYTEELCEALACVHTLPLKRCAHELREQQQAYLRWLPPLTLSSARDPFLEYLHVLALLPGEDAAASLPQWFKLVCQSGSSSQYAEREAYLTIGLRALRRLPNGQDDRYNQRVVLTALAWRAVKHYFPEHHRSEVLQDFVQLWRRNQSLYPSDPQYWRELEDDVLSALSFPKWQQRWLIDSLNTQTVATAKQKNRSTTFNKSNTDSSATRPIAKPIVRTTALHLIAPPFSDVEACKFAIQKKSPTDSFIALQAVLDERHRFAVQSGDAYYYIRTVSNLGQRWLNKWSKTQTPQSAQAVNSTPQLKQLEKYALKGIELEPSNPYVWMLWVAVLQKQNRHEVAHTALWDIRRRFPDDEHCRVELARLYIYGPTKRYAEAKALLQEVANQHPDNEPCRVELARLYIYGPTKRYAEAEALLQEVANQHPDHEPCRVELANLWVHLKQLDRARSYLVDFIGRSYADATAQKVLADLNSGDVGLANLQRHFAQVEFEMAHTPLERTAAENTLTTTSSTGAEEYNEEYEEDGATLPALLQQDLALIERDLFALRVAREKSEMLAVEEQAALNRRIQASCMAADPAMYVLSNVRSMWAGDEAAIARAPELAVACPNSYAAQVSATIWGNGAGNPQDAEASWEKINRHFYRQSPQTRFFRTAQGLMQGRTADPALKIEFKKWRDSLPAKPKLGEEAKQSSDERMHWFVADQTAKLLDASIAALPSPQSSAFKQLCSDLLVSCI